MSNLFRSMEFWNLVLNVMTIAIGCLSGFMCWCFLRPADVKMKHLESELNENNARMDSLRSSMLDACVRSNEARNSRMLESCVQVYKAYQHVASSCGVMRLCRGLRDLKEIRTNLSGNPALDRFGDWLMSLGPKYDVVWRHPDVLAVTQAEIFVPARIWNIYSAMTLLVGALQIQIASIRIELSSPLVDENMIYNIVDSIIPGQAKLLRQYGTAWYSFVVEQLRKELISEIRKVVGVDPVDAEALSDANRQVERILSGTDSVPEEFREFAAERKRA